MAIEQVTIITCDVCKRKMPERYGVSLETGQPRLCVEADMPTHEIDLCHRCAVKALQEAIDISLTIAGGSNKSRYEYIMAKLFPTVKRID